MANALYGSRKRIPDRRFVRGVEGRQGVALFRQGKNTQSDHVVFPSVSRLEKQIDALGVLESTRVARTCGELSSARCRPWQTTNTGVSALSRDYHELCREVLRCLPVLGI